MYKIMSYNKYLYKTAACFPIFQYCFSNEYITQEVCPYWYGWFYCQAHFAKWWDIKFKFIKWSRTIFTHQVFYQTTFLKQSFPEDFVFIQGYKW